MPSIAANLANVVVATASAQNSSPKTRAARQTPVQGSAHPEAETKPIVRRRDRADGSAANAQPRQASENKGKTPGDRHAAKLSGRPADDKAADARQGNDDLSSIPGLFGPETPFAELIKKLAAPAGAAEEASQKIALKGKPGAEADAASGRLSKVLALSSGVDSAAVGGKNQAVSASATVVLAATQQGARRAASQVQSQQIAKAHAGLNVLAKAAAGEANPNPQAAGDKAGTQTIAPPIVQPARANGSLQAPPPAIDGKNHSRAGKAAEAGTFEPAVTGSASIDESTADGKAVLADSPAAAATARHMADARTPSGTSAATAPQPTEGETTGTARATAAVQSADGKAISHPGVQRPPHSANSKAAPTAVATAGQESTNSGATGTANPENSSTQAGVGQTGPDRPAAVNGAEAVVSTRAPDGPQPATQEPVGGRAEAPDPAVANQVTEALRARLAHQGEQVVVRLDPPELGRIRVTFRGEGNELRAVMEVDNAKTLSELQREAPPLIQRLADSGIQLRRLEFVLNEPAASQGGEGAYAQPQQGHGFQQQQAGQQQSSAGGQSPTGEQADAEAADAHPAGEVRDDSINVWI